MNRATLGLGLDLLSSLHVSFALVSILLVCSEAFNRTMMRVESEVNRALNVPQTDVYGTVSVWVPTATLAMAVWLAIWKLTPLRARSLLRLLFGPIAAATPLLYWAIFASKAWNISLLPDRWPEAITTMIAVLLATLAAWKQWALSVPLTIILPAIYFVYWYVSVGDIIMTSYGGPFGPILGFFSLAIWGLYVRQTASRSNGR